MKGEREKYRERKIQTESRMKEIKKNNNRDINQTYRAASVQNEN